MLFTRSMCMGGRVVNKTVSQTCPHSDALSSEYRLIKHVLREKLLLKYLIKSQVIKMLRI